MPGKGLGFSFVICASDIVIWLQFKCVVKINGMTFFVYLHFLIYLLSKESVHKDYGCSGSKLFDTLIVILNDVLKKLILKKSQQTMTTKA